MVFHWIGIENVDSIISVRQGALYYDVVNSFVAIHLKQILKYSSPVSSFEEYASFVTNTLSLLSRTAFTSNLHCLSNIKIQLLDLQDE